MSFMEELRMQRQQLIDALEANQGDINLDIFEDFYPDRAHFVFELLQNAEDTGATECSFNLTSEELQFRHNGRRQFGEGDIKSITGIHNSTKTKSSDQIGKFGVGFKSVFIYTLTPQIHSGEYSFSIKNLVMPELVSRIPDLGNDTLFCLPFNNPLKNPKESYTEIGQGLRNLSELTLLFLKNIGSIQWIIDGAPSGLLCRVEHSEHHIEILKETDGAVTSNQHFLRFSEPVANHKSQHISLAFPLSLLKGNEKFEEERAIHEQFRIVSAKPGRVSVFFPAEKETSGLRFHIHGPFIPTLDRSSVKETYSNTELFAQVASFAAKNLHRIRDLELLSLGFLGVLPHPHDGLSPRYEPIRNAIVRVMKFQPLTPTNSGKHAPAKTLIQARATIKDLLDSNDIEYLVDYEETPPQWAVAATQKNNNVDRFLTSLEIRNWGLGEFLTYLAKHFDSNSHYYILNGSGHHDRWLEKKPIEWFQKFYAILYRELTHHHLYHRFRNIRFIKLTSGRISNPENCFFLSEDYPEDASGKWVSRESFSSGDKTTEQEDAQKLLMEVGVRDVGASERIELLLQGRYIGKPFAPKLEDIQLFINHAESHPKDIDLFKGVPIFRRGDGKWGAGSQVYIDDPYSETGLQEVYAITGDQSRKPLSEDYLNLDLDVKSLLRFAEELGAIATLEISEVSCRKNPEWSYLSSVPGVNITTPIDRDFIITDFESIFDQCSEAMAIIVWDTLCDAEERKTLAGYLVATFQKNQRGGRHQASSQLVHQLRNTAWVPQEGGPSVAPPDADPKRLPSSGVLPFDPNWKWVEELRFGRNLASEAEAQQKEDVAVRKCLGIEDEQSLDEIKQLVKVLSKLPPDKRRKHLDEAQQELEFDLPENQPKNEPLRIQRVGDAAANAAERETEKRERSISLGREAVKAVASQYLLQQYSNDDHLMICQICRKELPFKRIDGAYYFETVEFLPSLELRHRQNYLALCPNHAAMFKHANRSKGEMKDLFLEIGSAKTIDVDLGNMNHSIYFTDTHKVDLTAVIATDSKSQEPLASS
jgi:hypothetical protein